MGLPMGVTNASNALPGQVGEYFQFSQVVNFTQNVNLNATITMGTIPPGDWDAYLWGQVSAAMAQAVASQTLAGAIPPGMSWGLACENANPVEGSMMLGPMTRCNVTVPTAVVCGVLCQSPSASGTITFYLYGRRVR